MNERSPHGAAKSVRHGQRQRKMRAQQQRALATRAAILNAAIAEFAERGFEGASIRRIADRTGLQHPLITYHYRSKDILWRAAAEHAFTRIREEWDLRVPEQAPVSTLERLREEYRAVFHPQISAAQNENLLPKVEPILFHYMMVSLTATLSGFGPEMEVVSDLSPWDPRIAEAYWRLVEGIVFGKYPKFPRSEMDQCQGRNTRKRVGDGAAKRAGRRNKKLSR